jgi:Ca2+/Na+ antiporter
LIAPTRAIFDAVLHAFDYYVTETSSLRDRGLTELDDDPGRGLSKRDRNADGHTELIEPPKNASILELALWRMLFPLRVIMHYTLPDVRRLDHHGLPTASIYLAYLSTITSLSWLLLGSYVMVVSLETLAEVIGIPDAIMGVTLSAAGTSLPAYIASRIAAERGFGNQAVANIFGSNTFNICIGLGLPWVIYCLVNNGSYTELENEHILESILTMAGALLLFVVLMIKTNYVVLKWHADLYVLLYILYGELMSVMVESY